MTEGVGLNEVVVMVDELEALLSKFGVTAAPGSHFENDYYLVINEIEELKAQKSNFLSQDAIAAIHGFVDLNLWLNLVRERDEFPKLIPHLKLLSESSVRFNDSSPMMNPVTNKQDDKSNKLIETLLGMFAIAVGVDVDLDDPYKSSGGENPDILFTYQGKRIAIACKTPRSGNVKTLLDNFCSARVQIDRAECDIGYIAINPMNIFPHTEMSSFVYDSLDGAGTKLGLLTDELYSISNQEYRSACHDVFSNTKVSSTVFTLASSFTRLKNQSNGTTTIKRGCIYTFFETPSTNWSSAFLNKINLFIHARL